MGDSARQPKSMCAEVMSSGNLSPYKPSAHRLRRLRKELSPRYAANARRQAGGAQQCQALMQLRVKHF
jgi:hypothetical protein